MHIRTTMRHHFTIASKKYEPVGTNLKKIIQNTYTENYTTLIKLNERN